MNDAHENGWRDIHVCAANGYIKSIKRFVESDRQLLELETSDDLRQTPFLLAAANGQQETVACLIDLGAKVDAVDSQSHGAVETCAVRHRVHLLRYFINLKLPSLPVWSNLLRMLETGEEEEIDAGGKCLRDLTARTEGNGLNPEWKSFHENGGVSTVLKVARNLVQDKVKIPVLQTCLNVIERPEIQEQLVSQGGVPTFLTLLNSTDNHVIKLSAQVIRELSKVPDFSESLVPNHAISHLLKIIQTNHDQDILVPVIQSLSNIAHSTERLQTLVGNFPGLVASLVSLLNTHKHPELLVSLIQATSKIVESNKSNQSAFVNEGITQNIINIVMMYSRNKDIQATAVEVIHQLALDNVQAQADLLDKGVKKLLMQMLKKNRSEVFQEKIVMALWVLATQSNDAKLELANEIGLKLLIDFVKSKSENLHYIGSEGLGVLAQGPVSQQAEIAKANGVPPLVQLLESGDEKILLSVLNTIRYLCVGVGCVPFEENKNTVLQCQGVRLLVALMAHSNNEILQAEAAYTLGSLSLGNAKEIIDELHQNTDFSFVRILKMMYSCIPIVKLTAGSALACFAYKNLHQQREITQQGGLRFGSFMPFLQSDNEFFRCSAAYQVVVLAKTIADETQARSSAVGIQLLVDLLQDSKSEEVLALAADCVARLSHIRAGVTAAMIAVNVTDHLCMLLLSQADQVRGNASIALGYLSHNHKGERLILRRCRSDPYLMKVIRYYTKEVDLATTFTQEWKHYKKVGLPPIPANRPNLIQRRPHKDALQVPTILSLEETGSTIQSSRSATNEDGDTTSRSHRKPSHRDSSQNSLGSLPSQRSLPLRTSLVFSGNLS